MGHASIPIALLNASHGILLAFSRPSCRGVANGQRSPVTEAISCFRRIIIPFHTDPSQVNLGHLIAVLGSILLIELA